MRLLLTALLLACGSVQAAEPLGAGGYDVVRYDVSLKVEPASRSITGETRMEIRALAGGVRELAFSDNALTLGAVTVDGRPAAVKRGDGKLTVQASEPLPRDRTVVLVVPHSGVPKRGVAFDAGGVRTSYFACDWMICTQDRPGDKAAIALTLTVPTEWTTVANGRLASRSVRSGPGGGSEAVHAWREDGPYSAYVYGFAAGPYRTVARKLGGGELTYLGAGVSEERLDALFRTTPDIVRFFEGKAGLPLPGGRYAQVLAPGNAAQEAAGWSLIGENFIAPILETPDEDWVIAHELAHQWWGNLVTSESWDHFWINEGVTTFMVAAWKEHRWGRPAYEREMAIARNAVEKAEAAGVDVPLSFAGAYPSLGLRRAIQYSKGALFMDALRRELGEEAFWSGLRTFTRTHAGGTVHSRDVQRAFEKASGRDLTALFETWVY